MTDRAQDTVSSIAEASARRVLWEMENGVLGYAVYRGEPSIVTPRSVDRDMPSTELKAELHSAKLHSVGTEPPAMESAGKASVRPSVSDPSPDDPATALLALKTAIGECTRCALHRGRTHLVFGEGNPKARLVFVGEGPGRDEDLAGRPFVGEAGQLLTRIIEAMGLSREEVYICNVVKCRPPNNRTPEESETRICGPFVRRQIAVIKPEAVVALGATAASFLLPSAGPISRIRGKFLKVDNIPVMPTFHPAYLLRNPTEKRSVWNDMQMVMDLLGLRKPGK